MVRRRWGLGLIVGLVATASLSGCRGWWAATTQPVAPGPDLVGELAVGRLEAVTQAIWELRIAEADKAQGLRASLREALIRADVSGPTDMLEKWWQSNHAAIGRSRMAFQGLRAYDYLVQMCAFGPRFSGSEGLGRMQAFVQDWFSRQQVTVRRQEFDYTDPQTQQVVPMVNLIVSLGPETRRRLIVGTHIDTRRWADEEPAPRARAGPVLGANDGASGAAVLLELAEILIRRPPRVRVDLVFFDGEEYAPKGSADYFLGSKHFAAQYQRSDGKQAYAAAVIIDMVGGKRLRVRREPNSVRCAGALVDEIWQCARDLGHRRFVSTTGEPVDDDHTALNAAGIPSVLLIDFSYPHRHRHSDVPAQCNPGSLRAVGQVLTRWIYRQPRPI